MPKAASSAPVSWSFCRRLDEGDAASAGEAHHDFINRYIAVANRAHDGADRVEGVRERARFGFVGAAADDHFAVYAGIAGGMAHGRRRQWHGSHAWRR
jgi:hypothetical protein